jgi:hypothetical protein
MSSLTHLISYLFFYSTLTFTNSDLEWIIDWYTENVTLVDFTRNRTLFDYCDLTQYTAEGIAPLLQASFHHPGSRWIAYTSKYRDLATDCPSESWADSYTLYWMNMLSGFIQSTGATGLIQARTSITPAKFFQLPGLDKAAHKVFDVVIEDSFLAAVLENNSDRDTVQKLLDESLIEKRPLVVESISLDFNILDNAVYNGGSLFRILGIVAPIFSLICLVDSVLAFVEFNKRHHNNAVRNYYCITGLILSNVGNALRVVKNIDALGLLGLFPAMVGRSLYTVTLPITISSNLSSYYFWVDLIIIITHSMRLQNVNPSGTFKKLSIGLSLVMLLTLDLTLSIAGYNGRLKGEAAKIPGTVISALLGVIAIVNFYVSGKVIGIVHVFTKENSDLLTKKSRAVTDNGKPPVAEEARVGTRVSTSTGPVSVAIPRHSNPKTYPRSNKIGPEGQEDTNVEPVTAIGTTLPTPGGDKKRKIVLKLRRSFWSLMSSGVLIMTFITLSLMLSQNRQYLNVTLFAILYQGSILVEQLISYSNVQLLKIAMRPVAEE